jgi:hypothetical protein
VVIFLLLLILEFQHLQLFTLNCVLLLCSETHKRACDQCQFRESREFLPSRNQKRYFWTGQRGMKFGHWHFLRFSEETSSASLEQRLNRRPSFFLFLLPSDEYKRSLTEQEERRENESDRIAPHQVSFGETTGHVSEGRTSRG